MKKIGLLKLKLKKWGITGDLDKALEFKQAYNENLKSKGYFKGLTTNTSIPLTQGVRLTLT